KTLEVFSDPFAGETERNDALASYEAWTKSAAADEASFAKAVDAEVARTGAMIDEYTKIIASAKEMIAAHGGSDAEDKHIRRDAKDIIAFAEKQREGATALKARLEGTRGEESKLIETTKPLLGRSLDAAKETQPLFAEYSKRIGERDAHFKRLEELKDALKK